MDNRPSGSRRFAFFYSIRFRLALWFALVLLVVLLVFSAFVYLRTAQDLREEAAARLVVRLRDINNVVRRRSQDYQDWFWWRGFEPLTPTPFVLQKDEIVILSDSDGTYAEAWGPVTDRGVDRITRQLSDRRFASLSDRDKQRFFSFTLNTAGPQEDPWEVRYLVLPAPILYDNTLLGWIILGQPVDPENRLSRLFWTLLLAGSLTLLVALAGGYWLAGRSLWPVKAITRTAQEISESDLSRRLNIHTHDELGELAGTFDRMLDRLQAAFNRQRQFTADASHELRTPLTIIGLETSRALERKMPAEAYQRALRVIRSENEFMSRLVGELLTLARMDAGQVRLDQEVLDLSDVALEVSERYAQIAAEKGIQLKIDDLPELLVRGDRQFLIQMIGNLIDNAIKYTPAEPEKFVRVLSGADRTIARPQAWLRVEDNGVGIAPDHLPHIFDRFYRVDRARSHNPEEDISMDQIPGSGLGLSIVQWIAQMHGGFVCVASEQGKGSIFEVQLPLMDEGAKTAAPDTVKPPA